MQADLGTEKKIIIFFRRYANIHWTHCRVYGVEQNSCGFKESFGAMNAQVERCGFHRALALSLCYSSPLSFSETLLGIKRIQTAKWVLLPLYVKKWKASQGRNIEGEKKSKYISEIAIFAYPKIRQQNKVLIGVTEVEVSIVVSAHFGHLSKWRLNKCCRWMIDPGQHFTLMLYGGCWIMNVCCRRSLSQT